MNIIFDHPTIADHWDIYRVPDNLQIGRIVGYQNRRQWFSVKILGRTVQRGDLDSAMRFAINFADNFANRIEG